MVVLEKSRNWQEPRLVFLGTQARVVVFAENIDYAVVIDAGDQGHRREDLQSVVLSPPATLPSYTAGAR